MRLIDADAAKRKIIDEALKVISELDINTFAIVSGLINMFDCQDDFPTIEAVPVRHGAWLYNDMYLPNCAECSECGWKSSVSGDEISSCHYCPNCGARMVGGDNST